MRLTQITSKLGKNPFEKAADAFDKDAGKLNERFGVLQNHLMNSRVHCSKLLNAFLSLTLEERRARKKEIQENPELRQLAMANEYQFNDYIINHYERSYFGQRERINHHPDLDHSKLGLLSTQESLWEMNTIVCYRRIDGVVVFTYPHMSTAMRNSLIIDSVDKNWVFGMDCSPSFAASHGRRNDYSYAALEADVKSRQLPIGHYMHECMKRSGRVAGPRTDFLGMTEVTVPKAHLLLLEKIPGNSEDVPMYPIYPND